MPIGIVKFFNVKSGFGFIKDIESDDEYYFNGKSVKEELNINEKVAFEIKEVKRGKEAVILKNVINY